jgi:hypothetical protein
LNPLPANALLPLAPIWFGLDDQSLVFVLIHSVLRVDTLSGSCRHGCLTRSRRRATSSAAMGKAVSVERGCSSRDSYGCLCRSWWEDSGCQREVHPVCSSYTQLAERV